MSFKNAFKLVENRKRIRRKPFLKTIPVLKSSNLHNEAEPGERCTVILDGYYPLVGGETIVLFCQEDSFAVEVAVIESYYPELSNVELKDMIHLGCPTQEELFERVAKQNPKVDFRDIVTIMECEVV